MAEQGMNSQEGMDIKGHQRRTQRIESNSKRTKEEIRERRERETENSGLAVALNVTVYSSWLAYSI